MTSDSSINRLKLTIAGQVQGVGFRPTVYRLAVDQGLTGSVLNAPEGVIIELQGPEAIVLAFPDRLRQVELFRQVHKDWRRRERPGLISQRFHLGLAQGLANLAATLAAQVRVSHVALSGGVMHNRTISVELPRALTKQGLTPLVHTILPPGDACISLGQAVYGRLML